MLQTRAVAPSLLCQFVASDLSKVTGVGFRGAARFFTGGLNGGLSRKNPRGTAGPSSYPPV